MVDTLRWVPRHRFLAAMLIAGAAAFASSCGSNATGHVATIAHFKQINAVAASGDQVWVANQYGGYKQNGSVTELNAATGSVLRVIGSKSDRFVDPVAIAVAGDAVWVLSQYGGPMYENNATGVVTELSAATGRTLRIISSPSGALSAPDGICVVGTDIWVANQIGSGYNLNGSVIELSASTGKVVEVFGSAADMINSPVGVVADAGKIWIADGGLVGPAVTVLDARSGKLLRVVYTVSSSSNSQAAGIWASGRNVWVTYNADSTHAPVAELSAATERVIRSFDAAQHGLSDPTSIAVSRHAVWVTEQFGGLGEFNLASGAFIRGNSVVGSGPGLATQSIAVWGSHVWAPGSGESLVEIDASTGNVIRTII